jgi:hypothetical protein
MGYGHGIDPQDKGRLATTALKTVYYTIFNPVGKIDDTDLKHSDRNNYLQSPAAVQ